MAVAAHGFRIETQNNVSELVLTEFSGLRLRFLVQISLLFFNLYLDYTEVTRSIFQHFSLRVVCHDSYRKAY